MSESICTDGTHQFDFSANSAEPVARMQWRPMKIAFLVAKDLLRGGGGIEKYTREVGRRLVARGHQVAVYSTRRNKTDPDMWEGIKIRWMPRIRPYWAEKMAGSLNAAALAIFFEERPDVFHLHSVAAGGMAPLLGMRDVPCILQMHGVEWQRKRWGVAARATLRLLENVSFANATTVTAVSKEQCEFFSRRYRTPVSFIPTGTEVFNPVPPTHLSEIGVEPSKYFLTAVRLVQEKGVHYLIPAFRKAATGWKLVIAGGECGDRTYIKHLRHLIEGDDRILFLGHIQSPLLSELYSNAGAYVQASEIEGMSISLLDAMSYGCCCIASNIAENLDVLGDAGIAFRNKDVDDLALRMAFVAQSERMVATLGKLARARVRSQYSWDMVTTKLEGLYLEALERPYGYASPSYCLQSD